MADVRSPSTSRRARRRGRRSADAILRRSRRADRLACRQPPGGGLGEARLEPPVVNVSSCLLSLNLRGFLSHRIELEVFFSMFGQPAFVALTETWLDESVQSPTLEGYQVVSRLDRRDGRQGGGVVFFARADASHAIVHVAESPDHERVWLIWHTDVGPVLIGLWYRPPGSELDSIADLEAEASALREGTIGMLIVGDMNVHHKEWLRFSSCTSPPGRALFETISRMGLTQIVQQPTREEYLLDLVLTDFPECIKPHVIPGISDHSAVLMNLALRFCSGEGSPRCCWLFSKAKWQAMNQRFNAVSWKTLLDQCSDVDAMVDLFTDVVLMEAAAFIPRKRITPRRGTHPWINQRCLELIRRKHEAYGTAAFAERQRLCSTGLMVEYNKFVLRTKDRLASLPRSSKMWWKTSKHLMMKGAASSVIPPVQDERGQWALSAKAKADTFAKAFASKGELPLPFCGPRGTCAHVPPEAQLAGFLPIRRRACRRALKELRDDSATGPDLIPTRILKHCACSLDVPIAMITRAIIRQGRWPLRWRRHWVCPIHKRKSKAQPGNYRGIHLTAQSSKICERLLSSFTSPFFASTGAFGPHQFAYSKDRNAGDTLALLTMQWLWWMNTGKRIGVYCSDVSAAFDRVSAERLCQILRNKGVHSNVVDALESWLEPRVGAVVIDGSQSEEFIIQDSVFQGTVLGPSLWNCYFEDARHCINKCGFSEYVFADDLNSTKAYHSSVSNDTVLQDLAECQECLHAWGGLAQVVFDPAKESFHILHRMSPHGDSFKLLGIIFDTKLIMDAAVDHIVSQAGWRLRALLRTKRFHSIAEMMLLYKSHVLSKLEYGMAAFYHASETVLAALDRVQHGFLREICMSEKEALLQYNLSPLGARRDIAMLGIIHRTVLGLGHPDFQRFFYAAEYRHAHCTRLQSASHCRQLFDPVDGHHTDYFARSIFGLIKVYNRLPEHAVLQRTVKGFQGCLQQALRTAASLEQPGWQHIFHRC